MSKYVQFACGNCGNAFEDKRLSDDGVVHLRCNTCKAELDKAWAENKKLWTNNERLRELLRGENDDE